MVDPHDLISLFGGLGPRLLIDKAIHQTWGTNLFFGLRCDLGSLPPVRPAKFEITMTPRNSSDFTGFEEELKHVHGLDYVEVFLRQKLCEAEVKTLYVALSPEGSPAYVQWLITLQNQHFLHAHQPKRYPTLASDEVLLEGAHTFIRYRRTGVMADGMGQLLRTAKGEGAQAAYTYVGADNVPSLRGCANVGFTLNHLRLNTRRLGFLSSVVRPVDEQAHQIWSEATAPHALA